MTAPLNYSFAQVKPIFDRFMAHLSKMTPAQILALHDRAKKAITITIEDKYTLVVFTNGIQLLRDGTEIHASNTTVTHLSRMLRNSFR